jgi:hypothetical protein
VTKLNSSGTELIYSTYLGGDGTTGGQDWASAIAVDLSGNVYITGSTSTFGFPAVHAFQPSRAGGYDAFVAKLSPDGSELVYSTHLGGRLDDFGYAIAVDEEGNAHVTGSTISPNFPVFRALQPEYAWGACWGPHNCPDAFVTKLSPEGSALVYSTYLGGRHQDVGFGIAVDGSGSAHVVGTTWSMDFPTVRSLQPPRVNCTPSPPCADAFIAQITPDGSQLVYSTYLGGDRDDWGNGIAVDSKGETVVTGYTYSIDFPTVAALQPLSPGLPDVFITKLNAEGSALVFSTYLGGSDRDLGGGVALDEVGNVYVTGMTRSSDFPVVDAVQAKYGGSYDVFVAKLSAEGSALLFSTYLGGNDEEDSIQSIAVDASGSIYVSGTTYSDGFPTAEALQPERAGWSDAFVTKIGEAQK